MHVAIACDHKPLLLLATALLLNRASFESEVGAPYDEQQAIRPLVVNPDCHFLAVLAVLVQSVLEGGTDCPISGVFAGKTRAAAGMIAGLLVMDPEGHSSHQRECGCACFC